MNNTGVTQIICRFIRKTKQGNFETITWSKDSSGVKKCTVEPTEVTNEVREAIEKNQYYEINF